MKKAAVVFSAAAVMAITAVSVPTPVDARGRGGWGWGPGIAGGLIAGALIGGLASNAYGYGPGYGYYGPGPGYGYYGGYAPAYYSYGAPAYYGGGQIITADTDIAPSFPISAVIRWPVGNSRVRNRPQRKPRPVAPRRGRCPACTASKAVTSGESGTAVL